MTLVVDANVVVALVTKDDRAPAIGRQMKAWGEVGEDLHAPSLFRYEVANALTRKVVAAELELSDAGTAWRRVVAMPIMLHGLEDGLAVIAVARELQRESAYDAAYVVLAQKLGAELWTIDGPLSRNASAHGFPVHLIDLSS